MGGRAARRKPTEGAMGKRTAVICRRAARRAVGGAGGGEGRGRRWSRRGRRRETLRTGDEAGGIDGERRSNGGRDGTSGTESSQRQGQARCPARERAVDAQSGAWCRRPQTNTAALRRARGARRSAADTMPTGRPGPSRADDDAHRGVLWMHMRTSSKGGSPWIPASRTARAPSAPPIRPHRPSVAPAYALPRPAPRPRRAAPETDERPPPHQVHDRQANFHATDKRPGAPPTTSAP